MALSKDKTPERLPSGAGSRNDPPLERGEAALTQQDVHNRADAVETAATRPLPTPSGESVDLDESPIARDNLQSAPEAAKSPVAPGRARAEDKGAHNKK